MSVMIAHASIDERGTAKGGQAGDQTGREVCVRTWYNKPWQYVIRFRTPAKAEKVAQAMEWAAANDNIGYDQNQRNTLLKEARKYNYDVSKVKVRCETDCSALVAVACMYAGVPESFMTVSGNCAHTRNLRQLLMNTGLVDVYSSALYTQKTDRLKRGDILLKPGSHVAVVIKTDNDKHKSLEEVAREVRKGLWGNNPERANRLRAAGYNPSMIQAEVNRQIAEERK